jgi:hypothetical protein
MHNLLNIKNYIYSKGIMSSVCPKTNSLKGTHKGKRFKIFFRKSKTSRSPKAPLQMVLEIDGKLHYPKNNHVLAAILK